MAETKLKDQSIETSTVRLNSKIKTLTRDMTAASGNVAYTGVGFKPTAIIAFGGIDGGERLFWGMCDSTRTAYQMESYADNTFQTQIAHLVNIATSAGNQQIADVASFDTDGFTLTWTKAGSPTGTGNITCLCFR